MAYAEGQLRPVPCLSTVSAPGRPSPLAIALLGPGQVGSHLLRQLSGADRRWQVVAVADSRRMLFGRGLTLAEWHNSTNHAAANLNALEARLCRHPQRKVIVDVTASPVVASRHALWLEAGIHVVTANKWALAAPGTQHAELAAARASAVAHYEAAATVGAGLPMLATIDDLRLAGECFLSIGGVLSGSMSFVTARINAGDRPAVALSEARAQGLTEPDPRADLDGLDVARKLVILGRAAGLATSLEDVRIESLVPPELVDVPLTQFLTAGQRLDAYWAEQGAAAPGDGERLIHVGRLTHSGGARVGLERVGARNRLGTLEAGENLIEIRTDCYGRSPLIIRGPGAGIEVTTLALWRGLNRVAFSGCGKPGR